MEWLKDTAAALRLVFVGIEEKPAVRLRVVLKKHHARRLGAS